MEVDRYPALRDWPWIVPQEEDMGEQPAEEEDENIWELLAAVLDISQRRGGMKVDNVME